MKKILLLIVLFTRAGASMAQTTPLLKVYAYLRQSTPGAVPKVVADENGTTRKIPSSLIGTYYIYVEVKKGALPTPVALWINGEAYTVKKEAVIETPVLFKRPTIANQYETDSLVPKTKHLVFRLIQDSVINPRPVAPKKVAGNSLAVEYNWKGKKCFSTVKEWKKLPPLILE